jgi:hypothetical protein
VSFIENGVMRNVDLELAANVALQEVPVGMAKRCGN